MNWPQLVGTGILTGTAGSIGAMISVILIGFALGGNFFGTFALFTIPLSPYLLVCGIIFGLFVLFPYVSVREKFGRSFILDCMVLTILGMIVAYNIYGMRSIDGGDPLWVFGDFVKIWALTLPGGLLGVFAMQKLLPKSRVISREGSND